MHENILDTIEKPTATSRDFAWFVAKWSVIWAVVMLISSSTARRKCGQKITVVVASLRKAFSALRRLK
jgi:hypothetical protein